MYMLNMVIILIVMYSNVVTAIDKIPTYLLRFNSHVSQEGYDGCAQHAVGKCAYQGKSSGSVLLEK